MELSPSDGVGNNGRGPHAKPDGDSDTDTWTEDYTVAKAASYAAATTIVSLETVL